MNLRWEEPLLMKVVLIIGKNEIGTPSVKSEDGNTFENVEFTHCYPLRKNNFPRDLANYS